MVNWRDGGWTGSVDKLAHRLVCESLRNNPVARRSRYGIVLRLLRYAFSIRKFGRFLAVYMVINFAFLLAEFAIASARPDWLPLWTTPTQTPDPKAVLLNVSSYLITAQVGVLGVVSLALALVTLIAQRENSSTDVKIYYHESLSFEVVASCIALLAVLCAQLLWPLQFMLHRLGLGTELMVFRFALLGVHSLWLFLNLTGLAHFISTTFSFVQQSERERLRERYTANVVHPHVTSAHLRQTLYLNATNELVTDPETSANLNVTFGFDYGIPYEVEIQSNFPRSMSLRDVRMIWVRWVLRHWVKRCIKANGGSFSATGNATNSVPMLWFTPSMDRKLTGNVNWCCRRGGVHLNMLEKLVLRWAFRFRRANDER